jgi:phosphonate transport system permease protein
VPEPDPRPAAAAPRPSPDEAVAAVRRGHAATLLRVAAVLAVAVAALAYADFFDVERYRKGWAGVVQILVREGLPPDFARARAWVTPLFDTVAMSIGGTALAVAWSFVLAFAAARNTAPHPLVYYRSRLLLNLLRAVPELILGIILLAAVGLGILPGVLALGLRSVGMVGKFFAESIEHADPRPVEAVRACGGGPVDVLWHGILPQVLPRMADVAMYRWEFNFRASTVMGMIGCGGIGLELTSALNLMQYREVTALLIVVLACVTVVDAVSSWLRVRFQ